MQLTPRYDDPPVLRMEVPVGDPSVPFLRQRRRLAGVLAGLDADQWAGRSRCEEWSVQDVVAHLVGTNQFWAASVVAGLAGAPTRILATFDPVKTPALMVDRQRALAPSEVLDNYVETVEALAEVVGGLDESAWSRPAEAPPGHVALRAVVLHGLWDAWIHERDILLPLGIEPERQDDEVAGCLWYAAAVGPTLRAASGAPGTGTLAVAATGPDLSFVVDVGPTVVVRDGPPPDGAPRLAGDAVGLVEGLSFRAPLTHDLDEADRWLLGGLDAVFDIAPAGNG